MPAKTKAAAPRLTLAATMALLEKAGTAQARKTYARHGAPEPMFGVSFAYLKTLYQRIKLDHDLALALWDTGNFDARNLAVKIVDPARMSPAELDRWAKAALAPMCHAYVAHVAVESGHGLGRADAWLASPNDALRGYGWQLVAALAMKDESVPASWFAARLAEIEKSIHAAPNERRGAMNQALIAIGCRDAALRKAATAAAKRIGKVEIDHGDTSCKTPDAAEYIAKTWARSTAAGHPSPAAHERSRESMRTRC